MEESCGYDDIIVNSPGSDEGGIGPGAISIYLGSAQGLTDWPNSPIAGIEGENFGGALSTAGDVNGDGYDDIVVGAPFDDSQGTHTQVAQPVHTE